MTFRNLTPGSIIHVLVKGEPIEYKEGTVVSVGTPRMEVPSFNPNLFPMLSKPATQVVDVTYTVDGKNITDAVDVTANVFLTDKLGSIALVSTDKQDVVRELHATLNVSEGYLKDEIREQRMQEILAELAETDYLALKAFEGEDMSEHPGWKEHRSALREEYRQLESNLNNNE